MDPKKLTLGACPPEPLARPPLLAPLLQLLPFSAAAAGVAAAAAAAARPSSVMASEMGLLGVTSTLSPSETAVSLSLSLHTPQHTAQHSTAQHGFTGSSSDYLLGQSATALGVRQHINQHHTYAAASHNHSYNVNCQPNTLYFTPPTRTARYLAHPPLLHHAHRRHAVSLLLLTMERMPTAGEQEGVVYH
jgi:hypothetical protein